MKNENWKLTDDELARLDVKPVENPAGIDQLFMDEDSLLDESRMTHAEMQQLLREWRDDASQRPLWEKGVQYEDEYDRTLDDQSEQHRLRERDRGHER